MTEIMPVPRNSHITVLRPPSIAAGCSREVIERGADMLGWTLDDLISETILAMRAFDDVD